MKNVNNAEAHVNGPKKEHDEGHAEETSEGHGKGHGEQARKGGHQPSGATPGLQLQTASRGVHNQANGFGPWQIARPAVH
jgi:hypothetical protein